jgi:hypothetical protein
MNFELCKLCINEDFGYCGLRNSSEELIYEYNEKGDLLKCSGFFVDKERTNCLFKIKRGEEDSQHFHKRCEEKELE